MARYFAGNTLAAFARSSADVVEVTTAGRFNSSYVASAIDVPAATANYFFAKQPFMGGETSISGSHYLRGDLYLANFAAANPFLHILNAGANAYRIIGGASSVCQVQYWNSGTSAWVNWGSTFVPTGSIVQTFVLHLVPNVSFELKIAGSVVASSAVVPTNGAAAVDEFRFMATNNDAYWSQVMCADYDIGDSHLFSKLPSGEGTYTDGTGTNADVGETVLDDSTAIALPAVGNKHTFTKGAVATIPTGLTITGLAVNVRGRVGGGTVSDGKIKCRSSSTDSTSAGKSFGSSYEPRRHFFATDPATGTAWTKTGLDAAEVGLEAA